MALSAGQFMEAGEKRAIAAATGQAVATLTTCYMALLTAAPAAGTDATMAAETDYGATGYTRQALTTSSAWNAATSASPSVISNTASITWGPTSSSPGTTVTWGMLTDSTGSGAGGTAVLEIAYLLTTPRTPISGDSVQAAAGAFTAQV
jgi:hypothetical protein